jgi:prefoldin subunit 5
MLALQDHFKLLNSLKSLQQDSNSDTQVMVPQGRFALFKGKIKKPTKVFMDNGKGNMKEIPLETAISIVELKIAGGFHFEKPNQLDRAAKRIEGRA